MNIAGVDEAGRGPLAGPVMAAAVILDPSQPIEGLNDSKALSEKKRHVLFDLIKLKAKAWAIASASVEEIDTLNILQASLLAMKRAVDALTISPDKVLVDGIHAPIWHYASQTIIDGDALEPAISAASILAKVERDVLMLRLAEQYPQYAFEKHKGYGTKAHLQSLNEWGPCPIHRRSFAPVRLVAARQALDVR